MVYIENWAGFVLALFILITATWRHLPGARLSLVMCAYYLIANHIEESFVGEFTREAISYITGDRFDMAINAIQLALMNGFFAALFFLVWITGRSINRPLMWYCVFLIIKTVTAAINAMILSYPNDAGLLETHIQFFDMVINNLSVPADMLVLLATYYASGIWRKKPEG